MTISPLKWFKKHEKVRVMLVGKNGATIKFGQLFKEGDFVHDYAKDKAYGPMRLRPMFDKDGNPVYMFHEETGASLQGGLEPKTVQSRWDHRPIYDQDNNPIYPFEEETGKPVEISLDIEVLHLKTDPGLMGTLCSKTMLSNVLNRSPAFGVVIMGMVAAFAVGIIVGGGMG